MKKNSDIRFMRGVSEEKLLDIFDRNREPLGVQYPDDSKHQYHARMVCYVLKARTTTDLLYRAIDLLYANLELAKNGRPLHPTWVLPHDLELSDLLIGCTAAYPRAYFKTGNKPVNKAWACHAIHTAAIRWAKTFADVLRKKGRFDANVLADRLSREVKACRAFWNAKKMPLKIKQKGTEDDSSVPV